jgi:dihydropteroate synthase
MGKRKSSEISGMGARPLIMGVLNVTPDSFSDGGRFLDINKAAEHAFLMAESGADIIDIGGESTRPGSKELTVEEELERVIPVLERVAGKLDVPISIDTKKTEVAERAAKSGAVMINDVSGLQSDERIAEIAAEHDCYLILMHMRGTPEDMQEDTEYDDIIGEISRFLEEAAWKAIDKGVPESRIIVDPGIGFGKSVDGNYVILKNLYRFLELGYPVLVGASRKSFIGKALDLDVSDRLEGSLAAACYAVLNGADIVRVHDVAETKRTLTIIEKITSAGTR